MVVWRMINDEDVNGIRERKVVNTSWLRHREVVHPAGHMA
jgi:hypothetical protein